MNILLEMINAFHPSQDGFVFMWILASIVVFAVFIIIERFIDISRRTDVNAAEFAGTVIKLIKNDQADEALSICERAGKRALPRIVGAGLRKRREDPELILSAMEEETLHMIPVLERRVDLIFMAGNISTLLGLMGTIFGLILSFNAVAQPDVAPVEKTSMLATGISTAMNTTLFGLIISVPCVMFYSVLRNRIDRAVKEIEQYTSAVLKHLLPLDAAAPKRKVTSGRVKEAVDTEPNIAPMMNLMVILIPLLLSSAEFVKIGQIELNLPEKGGGRGGGGGSSELEKDAELSLGIAIREEGFFLTHYFKSESSDAKKGKGVDVERENGEYDYNALNSKLAEVKREAVAKLIETAGKSVEDGISLYKLSREYQKPVYSNVEAFKDIDKVKIVAEEDIQYEVVVAVMDAARSFSSENGNVLLFPNVSLAGGIAK